MRIYRRQKTLWRVGVVAFIDLLVLSAALAGCLLAFNVRNTWVTFWVRPDPLLVLFACVGLRGVLTRCPAYGVVAVAAAGAA